MNKTVLIIEDELPASQRLSRLLKQRGFEILDIVKSNAQSDRWFEANAAPDFIFADIRIADGLSFASLQRHNPKSKIVFTTAYPEFALEAFKHNGLEYLLKPIDEQKLEQVLRKEQWFQNLAGMDTPKRNYKESFLVPLGSKIRNVSAEQVQLFISQDNSSYIVEHGRSFVISASLEKLEQELNPEVFFRISRKCIISRNFVLSVDTDRRLQLQGYSELLLVSRSRYAAFLRWLNK
jgi:two-component system, LytTR family, response regulator LytT